MCIPRKQLGCDIAFQKRLQNAAPNRQPLSSQARRAREKISILKVLRDKLVRRNKERAKATLKRSPASLSYPDCSLLSYKFNDFYDFSPQRFFIFLPFWALYCISYHFHSFSWAPKNFHFSPSIGPKSLSFFLFIHVSSTILINQVFIQRSRATHS